MFSLNSTREKEVNTISLEPIACSFQRRSSATEKSKLLGLFFVAALLNRCSKSERAGYICLVLTYCVGSLAQLKRTDHLFDMTDVALCVHVALRWIALLIT